MDVELLAVTKITEMIARCPRLKADIRSNDKTPFIDGDIFIYAEPDSPTKKHFAGRVPVQVKGRTGRPGDAPTFSVPREDLDGFLRDRGVLYFVVWVEPSGRGRRFPYYCVLNPFKIEGLLRNEPTRKSIAVPLKRLPQDPTALEALLAYASATRREDPTMAAGAELLKNAIEFTIESPTPLDLAKPVSLDLAKQDFTALVTGADGSKAPLAGSWLVAPGEYLGVRSNRVISNSGHQFSRPFQQRLDEHTVLVSLSPGLQITVREGEGRPTGTVSITLQPTLSARLADVRFFLACMDHNGFDVDGTPFRFSMEPDETVQELRKHLEYLEKIEAICARLDINQDLVDLTEVSPVDSEALVGWLHPVLVAGQEVAQDFDGIVRVVHPVGRWRIQVIWLRGARPGLWTCIDPFGPEHHQQFAATRTDEAGVTERFRVTPYEFLDDDELRSTLNLRLSGIATAFDELVEYPDAVGRATLILLRLISAADAVPERRAEFLRGARVLSDWIRSKEPDEPIHRVNGWQIAAREHAVTPTDESAIRGLRRSAARSGAELAAELEVSCSILLGDTAEVEDAISELSAPELEKLKEWPIWTLYERGVDALALQPEAPPDDEARRAEVARELLGGDD